MPLAKPAVGHDPDPGGHDGSPTGQHSHHHQQLDECSGRSINGHGHKLLGWGISSSKPHLNLLLASRPRDVVCFSSSMSALAQGAQGTRTVSGLGTAPWSHPQKGSEKKAPFEWVALGPMENNRCLSRPALLPISLVVLTCSIWPWWEVRDGKIHHFASQRVAGQASTAW